MRCVCWTSNHTFTVTCTALCTSAGPTHAGVWHQPGCSGRDGDWLPSHCASRLRRPTGGVIPSFAAALRGEAGGSPLLRLDRVGDDLVGDDLVGEARDASIPPSAVLFGLWRGARAAHPACSRCRRPSEPPAPLSGGGPAVRRWDSLHCVLQNEYPVLANSAGFLCTHVITPNGVPLLWGRGVHKFSTGTSLLHLPSSGPALRARSVP